MMQRIDIQAVACPTCENRVEIPVPKGDVKLTVSPYVVAFGEHTKVDCPDGHTFWVYFCPDEM